MVNLVIADDEIAIRQGLEKLVTGFDLGVACVGTAADGEQALNLVEQLRPQLLLADINMPKMNGLEMISRARKLIPNGKIIVISGYDNFDFVRQALRLGVFDYLLKPINHGALYVTLSDAIEVMRDHRDHYAEAYCDDVVTMALHEISRRYSDKELRLAALAEELYVSAAVLSRGIKQRTGQTFSDYLTELRMRKAVELINGSGQVTVYTLADQVGCSSQHYFCKLFKDYMGCTPSEYIRRNRSQDDGGKPQDPAL